ncbi:MAG TPA: GNAT family N-acetyltransferase [Nitrospiraceae bacterium]|nr:GNAT family N-acetyltransferase [Nitrospiraceae bacterium]
MTGCSVYSYRRLVDVDEPIVWRMLYEAARVAEEGRLSPDSIRNDVYLAKYASGWGRPGDVGVAAFENRSGRPVGAAWVRLLIGADQGDGCIDDHTPELAIGVVPAHRGQGVGTELLRQLFEAARQPFSGITLTVRAGNQAVRLYERFGFQRLPGELVNRVGGQSVRMYTAWK